MEGCKIQQSHHRHKIIRKLKDGISFKNYKTQLQMMNSRMQSQIGWLHHTRFLVLYAPKQVPNYVFQVSYHHIPCQLHNPSCLQQPCCWHNETSPTVLSSTFSTNKFWSFKTRPLAISTTPIENSKFVHSKSAQHGESQYHIRCL